MQIARLYLLVSADEQGLTRQADIERSARQAGYYVAGVYREKASGARADRPYTTGQAHWEILLRARANQCYVLAAAQGGSHTNGGHPRGHSMLIDPWGEIVAILPEGQGVCAGRLDFDRLAQVRGSLPSLSHRRM